MRLHAEVTGAGPDVVLVHGRASNSTTWAPLLPYLEGFRVHRVDLLGHGGSPTSEDPAAFSMQGQTEALAETLADLDRPFHLIGHSMGGFVAVRYALQHPARLASLVLEATSAASPFSGGKHRDYREDIRWQCQVAEERGMAGLCDAMEAKGDLGVGQREKLTQQTPLAYVATAHAIRDMESLEDRLGELRVPTLVVCGYDDSIFLPECQRIAERIPGAEGLFLTGAAHSPHREAAERFGKATRRFLGEHSQQAGLAARGARG